MYNILTGETHDPTPEELDDVNGYTVACIRADQSTRFTDNHYGTCLHCGAEVQFRPYVPAAAKKICAECVSTYIGDLRRRKTVN
ncbi:hypothetical protein KGP36_08170 [Patescibacteria group bacterium]|nr:hypothetical protein [Patescibacteria group bacterium]